MPRHREERARVLGPYWHKAKGQWWAKVLVPQAADAGCRRIDRYFGSEREAQDWVDETRAKLARLEGRTLKAALDAFEEQLVERGNERKSRVEKMRRLKLFFADVEGMQVARLKPERAAALYAQFREGRSVDYHRNTLGNAKGFLGWCQEQGWASSNPLAGVKGTGKRSAGKLQLTGDEARKFHAAALELADQGDLGALGADMLLVMGLRQSEVTRRKVRDLDLQGSVLRIEKAKTAKGNRIVMVPEVLQSRLLELTEERKAQDVLFAAGGELEHTKAWLYAAVRRVCDAAGVTQVCPHGLRGTHASLALSVGEGAKAVADSLGHESTRTTLRHYAGAGSAEAGEQGRTLRVLEGGRR